jgi:hypothetical protein
VSAAGIGSWVAAHPRGVLAITAFGWAVYYAVSCWWFPFGNCWCCHGRGRHDRKDGRVFRDCRMCRGAGRRRRVGRTVFEWARRVVKNAT